MTCIVAVEAVNRNNEDVVVMAGDHLGSNGYTKNMVTQPKVFSHSGMVFGYTSTFRFGQLIEHCLDNNEIILPPEAETYKWLVKRFVPELKSVLKENEYDKGGNALIGVHGQVWELQSDFSVLRHDLGFGAVGSGEDHAQSSILTYMNCVLNLDGIRPHEEDVVTMLSHVFGNVSTFVPSVSEKFSYIIK